jgi:hypothetical protein
VHPSQVVDELEQAVLRTLAYADIFDFPLTAREIHRDLIGVAAPFDAIRDVLDICRRSPGNFVHVEGYFTLRGRTDIVATRRRRTLIAARLWPEAVRYGRIIANLPFVRMVAVTGALAVDNVEPGADIDYLIVTKPGRLWLCRGLIITVVRLAARHNQIVCPNYLLSERALEIPERTLYTAHELAQMIPIAGLPIYRRMRRINAWMASFLPNARSMPRAITTEHSVVRPARALAEAMLSTPAGGWIERWEMERKIHKLAARAASSGEVAFCADWCKGHFAGHGQRTLEAYAARLHAYGDLPV